MRLITALLPVIMLGPPIGDASASVAPLVKEEQADAAAGRSRDCRFTMQSGREACACTSPDGARTCTRFSTCVAYYDVNGDLCQTRCNDCDYVCSHSPCGNAEGEGATPRSR